MNNDQLTKFRSMLRERLTEIEAKTTGLRAELLQVAEVQPTVICDGLDHAKEETDLNSRLSIHACHMDLRDQLRTALRKIDLGTFGVCNECEEAIDLRRLEAQPCASFCVRCQRQNEFQKLSQNNPPVAWFTHDNLSKVTSIENVTRLRKLKVHSPEGGQVIPFKRGA